MWTSSLGMTVSYRPGVREQWGCSQSCRGGLGAQLGKCPTVMGQPHGILRPVTAVFVSSPMFQMEFAQTKKKKALKRVTRITRSQNSGT